MEQKSLGLGGFTGVWNGIEDVGFAALGFGVVSLGFMVLRGGDKV